MEEHEGEEAIEAEAQSRRPKARPWAGGEEPPTAHSPQAMAGRPQREVL